MVLYTYYLAQYQPPLFLLAPHVPGIFLYFHLNTQILTGSRLRVMDRAFGQPWIIRLHIVSALMIVLFILFHLVLRFDWYELGTASTISGFVGGFVVLYIIAMSAMKWVKTPFSRGKAGPYNKLRFIHNLMVPTTVLLWVHVIISSAHESNFPGTAIVTSYLAVVLILYFRHKWRSLPHIANRGQILSVERYDNAGIISLNIGDLSRPIQYQAGQYGYLRILGSGLPTEEHPFSFSSRNTQSGGTFQISIKAIGDYTKQLYERCVQGTPVSFTGPYGQFVFHPSLYKKTLCIAGGVGITPFLSIVEDLMTQNSSESVHLLWLCAHEKDFFAGEKLQEAANKLENFKLELVTDRRGENISPEKLKARVIDPARSGLYVCAPPPLMKLVIRCAMAINIPKKQIHHEAFSF